MDLTLLPDSYCILRFAPDAPVPPIADQFWSITRTIEELSLVCREEIAPPGAGRREDGWRVLKVEGPLDFALTGILASIAKPLAEAGVSIFAVSTFDTDYVLVREHSLDKAVTALAAAGHRTSR